MKKLIVAFEEEIRQEYYVLRILCVDQFFTTEEETNSLLGLVKVVLLNVQSKQNMNNEWKWQSSKLRQEH